MTNFQRVSFSLILNLFSKELVTQLKAKLDAGRKSKETTTSKRTPKAGRKTQVEEEVILTRTDKHGNIYPLKVSGEESTPMKKRRKVKKVGHEPSNDVFYHLVMCRLLQELQWVANDPEVPCVQDTVCLT